MADAQKPEAQSSGWFGWMTRILLTGFVSAIFTMITALAAVAGFQIFSIIDQLKVTAALGDHVETKIEYHIQNVVLADPELRSEDVRRHLRHLVIEQQVKEEGEWVNAEFAVFSKQLTFGPGRWRAKDHPEYAIIARELAAYVRNLERRYGAERLGTETIFEGGADNTFADAAVPGALCDPQEVGRRYAMPFPLSRARVTDAVVNGERQKVRFRPGLGMTNAQLAVLRALDLADAYDGERAKLGFAAEEVSRTIQANTSCSKGKRFRFARITIRMKRLSLPEKLWSGFGFVASGGALRDI